MNFNFVNYLHLFKLLLLNQNNPTAVWLILLGMRNKKKMISEKKNIYIEYIHTHSIYIMAYNII